MMTIGYNGPLISRDLELRDTEYVEEVGKKQRKKKLFFVRMKLQIKQSTSREQSKIYRSLRLTQETLKAR